MISEIQMFLNRPSDIYGYAVLVIHKKPTGRVELRYLDSFCGRNDSFAFPNKSTLLQYLSLFFSVCAADTDTVSGFQTIQFSITKFPDFILKNDL